MKRNLITYILALLGLVAVAQADQWAQVQISVGCLRTEPRYASEQSTQAILGMPVKVLDRRGDWYNVQMPDGYKGWIFRGSIILKTPEQMADWRKASRLVVTDPYQIIVYDAPNTSSPRQVVSDLVNGSIVEGDLAKAINGRVMVTLPDGRHGWADASAFAPIADWAAQEFNPEVILDQAYALEGAPYLWGGTSSKAMDCSGLVKICYLANGYILMRDASQQARTGTRLNAADWPDYQQADLLFFGNKATGKVTHVALYDHDGKIIHCAGRVKRNSVDPKSPDYLGREILHAVRINGNAGSEGIVQARNHPWFF